MPFSFHEFLTVRNPRLARVYEEHNSLIKKFILEGRNFQLSEDPFTNEFFPLFEEYLIFGGYPEVVKTRDSETKKVILKNIYDTYISRDVIGFLRVSDPLAYRCIVRALSATTGGMLDYNKISSSCGSSYRETRKVISMLSETYILHLLPPFFRNPVTELRKTRKVYFFDSGLRNHIINNFNPLDYRTDSGALVENHVFSGLFRMLAEVQMPLAYWRTISKAETDFVIDGKIPIEVKYTLIKGVPKGLRSFIEKYQPKRALVLARDSWKEQMVGKTITKFIPLHYI